VKIGATDPTMAVADPKNAGRTTAAGTVHPPPERIRVYNSPWSAPEDAMSKLQQHGVKELAAAIRRGMQRRPDQAFGDYYVGRRASCALGAAYEGMYALAEDMNGRHPTRDLDWYFDCLDTKLCWCPVDGCKKHLVLAAMIVHLNDAHKWSREEIALWVERQNGPQQTNGAAQGPKPSGSTA
jgi:hypothetical protein